MDTASPDSLARTRDIRRVHQRRLLPFSPQHESQQAKRKTTTTIPPSGSNTSYHTITTTPSNTTGTTHPQHHTNAANNQQRHTTAPPRPILRSNAETGHTRTTTHRPRPHDRHQPTALPHTGTQRPPQAPDLAGNLGQEQPQTPPNTNSDSLHNKGPHRNRHR